MFLSSFKLCFVACWIFGSICLLNSLFGLFHCVCVLVCLSLSFPLFFFIYFFRSFFLLSSMLVFSLHLFSCLWKTVSLGFIVPEFWGNHMFIVSCFYTFDLHSVSCMGSSYGLHAVYTISVDCITGRWVVGYLPLLTGLYMWVSHLRI
jgi:hypothetical protein